MSFKEKFGAAKKTLETILKNPGKTAIIVAGLAAGTATGQTTTTVQGHVNDKDYPSYSLNSTHVYAKDQTNQTLFDTLTDQNGDYTGKILTTGINDNPETPNHYELYQNYPNPYNPSTKIMFSAKEAGNYTLEIFNAIGQKLISKEYELNKGLSSFDVSGLGPSGPKFYRITSKNFTEVKKMMQLDGSAFNPKIIKTDGGNAPNQMNKEPRQHKHLTNLRRNIHN